MDLYKVTVVIPRIPAGHFSRLWEMGVKTPGYAEEAGWLIERAGESDVMFVTTQAPNVHAAAHEAFKACHGALAYCELRDYFAQVLRVDRVGAPA